MSDPGYVRTWLEALRYMRACNFFSSRTKPDYAKLARFEAMNQPTALQQAS